MRSTCRIITGRPHGRSPEPADARRGAMLVLVSTLLVLLLAMSLFTVDVAYMQLTRSELRSACDAAAKAGAEALRRTRDPQVARAVAIDIAAKNSVGGQPLIIRDRDIELGDTRLKSDGSWEFAAHHTPYTAVRVTAALGGSSGNPPVNLFFADIFGSGAFEPTRTSTAAHTAVEICLCIDRSHSMCFDLSGVDWVYPSGTPTVPHPIAHPPHPRHSRWASLLRAIDDFADVLSTQDPTPRVGLVTWGSNITLSSYEGRLTGLTFPAVSFDLPLQTAHGKFVKSLKDRSLLPILGGTNMSAGLTEAIRVLTDANTVNPLASRIVVLMSDGLWNQGIDPVIVARTAKSHGLIVHTISFLADSNHSTMQQVAEITGGRFYVAANEAELREAFIQIARQLPVVLTH